MNRTFILVGALICVLINVGCSKGTSIKPNAPVKTVKATSYLITKYETISGADTVQRAPTACEGQTQTYDLLNDHSFHMAEVCSDVDGTWSYENSILTPKQLSGIGWRTTLWESKVPRI